VLIIDRVSESRDVLQTLLERNGTRAIGVGETAEALRAAETDPPDLIVIDLDSGLDRPEATCQQLRESAARKNTPIVVIGSVNHHRVQLPGGRFIAKPYHYRDLLRRIESLLDNAA